MTYCTPPQLDPIPDQIVKGEDGWGVLMLDGVVYEVFLPPHDFIDSVDLTTT